ncbi:MAG: hypothetical protein GXP59_00335, partial [Deltaproteobacteria bacterium]|nr:hypothetical protein [Deltaproteobacteria bacterium]
MVKSKRKIPARMSKLKIVSIVLILLAVALIGKLVYDHERPVLPESWSVAQIENPGTNDSSGIKNQQMPAPVAAEPTLAS